MTKEQEAIKRLKSIDETVEEYDGNILKADIETVFNIIKEKNEEVAKKDKRLNRQFKLLNKKDKEIEKKDKIIDLMAEWIEKHTKYYDEDGCYCEIEKEICEKDIECKDCIKQYFKNKAKE